MNTFVSTPGRTVVFSFRHLFTLLGMALVLAFTSCGSSQERQEEKQQEAVAENAEANTEVAEEMNDQKFDGKQEDDATFLAEAAQLNMLEIDLGKLAQKNAVSEQVKELGRKMENTHEKAQKDLKALAGKKQVTLPETMTEEGTECYQKMKKITGSEFERDYCDKMVEGHQKAIEKFEKAAGNAVDADIKAWAASILPELRAHLDHATMCRKQMDKKS